GCQGLFRAHSQIPPDTAPLISPFDILDQSPIDRRQDLKYVFSKEGIIYFSGQISIRDLEGENQGTPDFRCSLQECRSDLSSTELGPLTSSLSDTSSGV